MTMQVLIKTKNIADIRVPVEVMASVIFPLETLRLGTYLVNTSSTELSVHGALNTFTSTFTLPR